MKRTRAATLATLLGAIVVAGSGCGGGGGDEGAEDTGATTTAPALEPGATLEASFGPGFEIGLATAEGEAVTSVPAGEYTIEVDDRADIHNFHLTGPGADEDSGVSETGRSTWTLVLQPGTYTFVCDPHASSMRGSFEVTG